LEQVGGEEEKPARQERALAANFDVEELEG
jgi:hypothetical protein